MFDKIIDPSNGKKSSIFSNTGKKLLKKYVNYMNNLNGGGRCSICGAKGVSKLTCPGNPKAKNPNSKKHNRKRQRQKKQVSKQKTMRLSRSKEISRRKQRQRQSLASLRLRASDSGLGSGSKSLGLARSKETSRRKQRQRQSALKLRSSG